MNFMQPNGTFGPRVIVPVDWPPMRERVRECLLLGFSSAQIAKALTTEFEIRVTRNMVIGQIRRHPLGELARRNKWGDVLDPNMPRKPRAPRKRVRKSRAKPKIVIEIPQVEIDDQQIPIEQRCTLIQLNEHTCRYPVGDPVLDKANFFFLRQMLDNRISTNGTIAVKTQIAPPIVKIQKPIDELLSWAYVDELILKGGFSSSERNWHIIKEYGARGGVDIGYSSSSRYTHFEEPHPDAKTIEAAVNALPDVLIDWKKDYEIIAAELSLMVGLDEILGKEASKSPIKTTDAGYYDEPNTVPEPPRRNLLLITTTVEMLIHTNAIQNLRPSGWRSNVLECSPIPAIKGTGEKLVGECRGKNLYTSGSYCPIKWTPSPIKIILARANYLTWHRALVTLAESLELTEHVATVPTAPATPWIDEGPAHWLIGPIKRPKLRPLPLKPERKRAGPKETPPRYPGRRIGP